MSQVLTPQKALVQAKNTSKTPPVTTVDECLSVDFDDFTTSSSILEFLSQEQECCSEDDPESIFQEVSRLADNSDTRTVDEILREAEILLCQQTALLGGGGRVRGRGENGKKTVAAYRPNPAKQSIKMNSKYTKRIENVRPKLLNGHHSPSPPPKAPPALKVAEERPVVVVTPLAPPTPQTPLTPTPTTANNGNGSHFAAFVDNLPSESVISEESTPANFTATDHVDDDTIAQLNDDDDDGTDTMEEITEGMETIELLTNDDQSCSVVAQGKTIDANASMNTNESSTASNTNASFALSSSALSSSRTQHVSLRRPSSDVSLQHHHKFSTQPQALLSSPTAQQRPRFNATQACSRSPPEQRRNSFGARRSSMTTPDSGIGGHTQSTYSPQSQQPYTPTPSRRMVSSTTSPIESLGSISREHSLKQEIDQLQEKLKDTEERLQSLRLQHDSLSQVQRDMRETNAHMQDESEMLKMDVQHLKECANILRSELKSARTDRNDALELQKTLQTELEDCRQEKKQALDQKDKDVRTIQDLQRQCREMERILMRKYPDSVSALIVAAKNPGKYCSKDQENLNSRKLLEQRIEQLEADAKEQDLKAQKILADVQERFNSVQAKYETHIADLETQVLSLQEINTKLNEKIESQVRTLDYFFAKKAEKGYNNCTQTDVTFVGDTVTAGTQTPVMAPAPAAAPTITTTNAITTRDHSTNTIGQHSASSSTSSTANSTPNTSRPNSKQSGLRKPTPTGALTSMLSSKLPVSQSDSTISLTAYHAAAKEDAHLLATIRGMRVDLAIKNKAMQRLTRELDDCKKTIRKLQREKDMVKSDKAHSGPSSASTSRRSYDAAHYADHNTESQVFREAQNKFKLLEADYKSLHDKRLQDLKTLQISHERELASCHETVRILQQRLNERDEAFAMQKRRKVPVDYYALKAKVTSLERRHSEREDRLHMLVEALSKGRLNGALEGLMGDNNNQ